MNILVTGANGFVGRALCGKLEHDGHHVVRAVRKHANTNEIEIGNLSGYTDWQPALKNKIDVVIHLAARVSLSENLADTTSNQLISEYCAINTEGTKQLARLCAQAGAKRFIFISTIKVLGEGRDGTYRSDDPAIPVDAYAISKWEAEQALKQIGKQTGMEIVIIRPPLVYGPGVKGNFMRMLQTVDRQRPLPLGAIHNRRSLIYLGNLVDVIKLCLAAPAAAGKTWLVSDSDDVSTPELIRRVAQALGRRALLLPVPVSWMRRVGQLLRKEPVVDRLVSSLSLDIQPINQELGWTPPYTMQQGLETTVAWYRQTHSEK